MSIVTNLRAGLVIDRPGPFDVEVSLQFNLPAGVYLLEAHPYDGQLRRPMQQSLVASMTVTEGKPFVGRYQLNPTMHFAERAGA